MDKTHWFPVWSGTKENPVKVVCNCDGFDILSKVGFVKDLLELESAKSDKFDVLDELTSKDEIEVYVKEKTGFDIDKRGSLETVKEKAKAVLNESGRADT